MEMPAPDAVADATVRIREQAAHHRRIGIADGVGETDAIRARLHSGLEQPQHLCRLDAPLDRAAERRADADLDETRRSRGVAAARMRAMSATTSSGVLRRLARLWRVAGR
jgi:hypothetical protein